MKEAVEQTNPWTGPGLSAAAKQLKRTVNRNAGQVLTYLEIVHHKILPGGGVPETPMSRKERGGSRLPLTDGAVDLAEANAGFTSVLAEMLRPKNAPSGALANGEPCWRVLSDLLFEATAVRTWRAQEAGGRPENMEAAWELCRRVALALAVRRGPAYLLPRVVTNTRDAAEILLERTEQAKNPNREPPKVRAITAADSYRAIVRDLERMVEEEGWTKEGAKWRKAEELGCSVWRIRDAVKAVNKERETLFSGHGSDDDAA